MIRSECLKLKNSLGFYLVFLFTLLELLTVPIYFAHDFFVFSVTGYNFVYSNL